MKKIGVIGGLAWPSTADYYRLICTLSNRHFNREGQLPPLPTLPMVIESLNINETRAARGIQGDEASWQRYDAIFRDAFIRLQRAGAEFGIIASNTPHTRLHSIRRGLDLPVISILETTSRAVALQGGQNALVLGTPVTMRSSVYAEVLSSFGVTAITGISDDEIEEIGRLIDEDLYQGKLDRARKRMLEISKKYVANPATDLVCLACTELPLAFPEYSDTSFYTVEGIGFINTIVAHVEAVIDESVVR